ncbi:MAG TPA: class I SAM-dependent methyltransferase [Casimicrobiaceae bacterium]|nr:class I SAM-dependent methyltransferase [Casimicrobiaceae bacterium]
MTPGHAEQDRAHHDAVAPHYDELVNTPRDVLSSMIFAKAAKYLPVRSARMLDLGAGTGHMASRFGDRFESVVLVDHSEGMLARARENLRFLGTRATFVREDVIAYVESSADRFDLVACVGVLHHLAPDELRRLLSGVVRRMTAGGAFIFAEPVGTEASEPTLVRRWNAPRLPELGRYLELAPPPEEEMLDRGATKTMLAELNLRLVYERRAWELYARYSGNFVDRLAIRAIDALCHRAGMIWFGVARISA